MYLIVVGEAEYEKTFSSLVQTDNRGGPETGD